MDRYVKGDMVFCGPAVVDDTKGAIPSGPRRLTNDFCDTSSLMVDHLF